MLIFWHLLFTFKTIQPNTFWYVTTVIIRKLHAETKHFQYSPPHPLNKQWRQSPHSPVDSPEQLTNAWMWACKQIFMQNYKYNELHIFNCNVWYIYIYSHGEIIRNQKLSVEHTQYRLICPRRTSFILPQCRSIVIDDRPALSNLMRVLSNKSLSTMKK